MAKKTSVYKKIFEDISLTDTQKYNRINFLQTKRIVINNSSRFLCILIGLNIIIWPLIITIPNTKIDNTNSKKIGILATKNK